ncbi:ATP synthase F1 subunit delta [Wenyingzhuangia sp. 2_MG-2023]|uniref:ATP synthase F1 subunit delta n=1 Tax=Wenyingzhuangia sp. 2_MG-2023 TaxID=3062639 RepID=UPI0026E31E21|nr:ATP synthase F1 subunit delta [Wenyingzhuangia sp. 2_MG-2023]MDO6736749.1 ATP synthase F1 subunit delta [Wenyingzhuangia sp. 2_MG-2023]MDO6800956.1 ATP synthase F1 subunit delta [Wenyingzhuangia sp. 1_MG-2023]
MSTRAAIRYAKAILNLAKTDGSETAVYNDMQLIEETIQGSDDLKVLLKSPIIKLSDKVSVLEAIFGSKVNNYSLGLIKLLANKKRLDVLETVASDYQIIYDHLKSIDVAKVTTAVPLSDALRIQVIAKVKELTGNETTLNNDINPDIIGGFILRVGDIQYDASIAKSLRELERSFDDSHYEAKI